jgi:hypothetical protein
MRESQTLLPLRQALLAAELEAKQLDVARARGLRDALLTIEARQQAPTPPVALPQRTPEIPPITQTFFGDDPESLAKQQAAFVHSKFFVRCLTKRTDTVGEPCNKVYTHLHVLCPR